MRYLLDTNIISDIAKPAPSESLLAWMSEQNDEDLYIASRTVAEIRRGVLEKPAGKRRGQLDVWFSGPEGPQALFSGRVLSFDDNAGLIWACLMAGGKALGRSRSALDTIIAAVAEAYGCTIVTDNEKDFPTFSASIRFAGSAMTNIRTIDMLLLDDDLRWVAAMSVASPIAPLRGFHGGTHW